MWNGTGHSAVCSSGRMLQPRIFSYAFVMEGITSAHLKAGKCILQKTVDRSEVAEAFSKLSL
jgi:hypothetical protein